MSLRKSNPFGAQYETSQDDDFDALRSSSSAHHRQQDSTTFAPSFAFYDTQGGDDWSPSPVHRQSKRAHTSKPAKKSTHRSSVEAPAASSSYSVVATVLPSKRRALSTSAYVSKARASTSNAKMEDVFDLTEVVPDEAYLMTRSNVTRGGTKPAQRISATSTVGTSSPRRAFVRVDVLKKESSPKHLVKSSGAKRVVVSKPVGGVGSKRTSVVASSSPSKSKQPYATSSGAKRVIVKR